MLNRSTRMVAMANRSETGSAAYFGTNSPSTTKGKDMRMTEMTLTAPSGKKERLGLMSAVMAGSVNAPMPRPNRVMSVWMPAT